MGMSRCYSLMKCLLILFNIILLVVGAGACGAAGWALWEGRAGETPQGRAALCALAAWGAALALGAFTAIAGAVRQSASLLACGFLLLALTVVALTAAAWWGAAHLPQLRAALTARLRHTVTEEYGQRGHATAFLDYIQQELKCCGAESPRDWQSSVWARSQVGATDELAPPSPARRTLDLTVGAQTTHYTVPPSCCATGDPGECAVTRVVPAASGGAAGLWGAGCARPVLAELARGARGALAGGAALIVLHALALLLTGALALRANPAPRYKA